MFGAIRVVLARLGANRVKPCHQSLPPCRAEPCLMILRVQRNRRNLSSFTNLWGVSIGLVDRVVLLFVPRPCWRLEARPACHRIGGQGRFVLWHPIQGRAFWARKDPLKVSVGHVGQSRCVFWGPFPIDILVRFFGRPDREPGCLLDLRCRATLVPISNIHPGYC